MKVVRENLFFILIILSLLGILSCTNPAKKNTGIVSESINIDDFHGTDIQKINSAIEKAHQNGGGTVNILRNVLINSSIILKSNVTLQFSDTIKVANKVFDTVIRVGGIIFDPENPNGECLLLNETSNIKILGIGENAVIEGCDIPYRDINPKTKIEEDWVGDYFGWRTISILLANTKNYELANFKIHKTKCWAISQEWGCESGFIHDIEFDTRIKNGDGIDFRNGCKNIVVENITGYTSDDAIACTALNNSVWNNPNYVYPLQTMGYEYKRNEEADIHDITINNVHVKGEHHTVICLTTSPKIYNISISNISDVDSLSDRKEIVKLYSAYGNGFVSGNLSNITISDIVSYNAALAVWIDATVFKASIRNIKNLKKGGRLYDINPSSKEIEIL